MECGHWGQTHAIDSSPLQTALVVHSVGDPDALQGVAKRHTLRYRTNMITYHWDDRKNAVLKKTRGVSFEQVVMHIESGDVLDVMAHPNKARYPNQQILVVKVNEYAYAVPFVEQSEERFLKTIVPSRKLTKQYLR